MRYALHWGEARISAIRDVSREIREFTIVPDGTRELRIVRPGNE